MFSDSCCVGTYSPFFTFFEDLPYFIKGHVILVRDLEQKKASTGEASRLLALSSTSYFTERNKKNPTGLQMKATALPYKGNTKC